MSGSNLTRDEARERAALVSDAEYDVALDLRDEDGFRGETVVRFACAEDGASTFLDCASVRVEELVVNGERRDPAAHRGTRISLDGLAERNEVRIVTAGEYSRTGKGLNRFRDPVDDAVYVFSDSEPFEAHRFYPSFDQPDIKARVGFTVTAPADWEVLSNSAVGQRDERDGVATVRLERTPPIPTYTTVVAAGPFAAHHDRYGEVELGMYCRRSLAEHLQPEEWFEVTKQGFAFFEEAFGYPYPFGKKYDQVVVPEFAAGAMENPGCVTYHERYIFRSKVTDSEHELRAGTILHEMAHMWFGDLVTMRWWDDLWLNESFASYMGTLAEVEATRFREGWTVFANTEKTWALQQDQLPTTHPIVADIPDVHAVHLNFDGITYAKGASVLKQLVAWVGIGRFLEAMKIYFSRHEYSNATLADFLASLEELSGRDLRGWSREWLETAGVNTLSPRFEERDGRFASFHVSQHAPAEWPTLRSHRVAVGLYEDRDGRLVRTRRAEFDVTGATTEVGDLQGEPVPPLVILNDDDLTFAKIRWDPRSQKTVRDRLGDIEGALARALCWASMWDMARDAELRAREYVDLVLRHGARETEVAALERILSQASVAIDIYGDPANREEAGARLSATALERARAADPGSDHQLAWAHAFVQAARTHEQLEGVRQILAGSELLPGLVVDVDLRWLLVRSLAAAGVDDAEPLIQEELRRDPTDLGERRAASARAAMPTPEAKADAWARIVDESTPTLAMVNSLMRGFQQPGQEHLLEAYTSRYFETLPLLWDERPLELALDFGEQMFPRWFPTLETIERVDRALEADLPGPLRRILLEGRDRLARALRAREADAQLARR